MVTIRENEPFAEMCAGGASLLAAVPTSWRRVCTEERWAWSTGKGRDKWGEEGCARLDRPENEVLGSSE